MEKFRKYTIDLMGGHDMSSLCGAEAKEFVKLVDALCGRRSRWEVWKDMT